MDFNKIKAIRPLRPADRMHNLTVRWMITRRCNYDCSYCAPYSHDFISPFIDEKNALIFLDKINKEVTAQNKKISWIFTGGEPFIDPGFLTILKELQNKKSTSDILAISNGSASLDCYLQACEILSSLNISLHLERSEKEINKTVKKIIEINKLQNIFFNVSLMFMPGKLKEIKKIISIFKNNCVNYSLVKIIPKLDMSDDLIHYSKNKKHGELKSQQQQIEAKFLYKNIADIIVTDSVMDNYYSTDELDFFEKNYNDTMWKNIEVWDSSDNYIQTNSPLLAVKNANKFKDWLCFAGVDSIYIDTFGDVYKGSCLNNGKIGNIYTSLSFFKKNPTFCEREWCRCDADVTIKKCKNKYDVIKLQK